MWIAAQHGLERSIVRGIAFERVERTPPLSGGVPVAGRDGELSGHQRGARD
jgi:hypothetical protein